MIVLAMKIFIATSLASASGETDLHVNNSKSRYKPGTGLVFESNDGDFVMATRLRAQMRYTLSEESEELSHGFQLRRARVQFKGNVFGEDNRYKFELAVSPRDIGLKPGTISKSPLLDWYFQFEQLRDLTLRVGQYKVPYSRERVVSSGNLQMVDRSLTNGEFTMDRDLGFDVRSKNLLGLDLFRYYAGVYMGEGHSSYANGDFGMMYLARFEVLPLGLFKDYSQSSLKRSTTPKLSAGVGYSTVQQAKRNKGIIGSTPEDGGTTDTQNLNADITFRYAGLSFEGAYFLREGARNPVEIIEESSENADGEEVTETVIEAPRNGSGFYVQGGYLFANNIEASARYGKIMPGSFGLYSETGSTGVESSSLSNRSEAGVALSRYIGSHSFKIQGDIFRYWTDDGFAEGDTELRVQLQMAY